MRIQINTNYGEFSLPDRDFKRFALQLFQVLNFGKVGGQIV